MIARPLSQIGTSAAWLRERLSAESVAINPRSELASALDALTEMRRVALGDGIFRFPNPNGAKDAYDFFSKAIGADFLSKALHWGSEAGFVITAEKWTHLISGDPILTRPGESSSERNWTWEVVLASLAATFAKNVHFGEPDVLCDFDGRTYAIAAKVAYSDNKLIANVRKGFKQADGKADASLVFVDVVRLYPVFDTFVWSFGKAFASNDDAVNQMMESVGRWCEQFSVHLLASNLKRQATVETISATRSVSILPKRSESGMLSDHSTFGSRDRNAAQFEDRLHP